ncbi:MAG: branched-chain amino acid ABC transporter permease [Deltaproteobacteria bacterium]|jgi:branched-chain amino acid transport system permease protein|nr:branched-chain amino acid ABC transporter permease [Deltaproteobacteria bacterium]
MSKENWFLIILVLLLAFLPLTESRFYVFLGTDILIMGLFAVSLNLLLGYTGLVSFGQAAYFGIGAYTCALLMKKASVAFPLAFVAAAVFGAIAAMIIGFFCIRLTKIYFAMLTLAFSQIVWAIAFKWNSLTGGDTGLIGVNFPAHLDSPIRFFYFTLAVVALSFYVLRKLVNSPFGRILTTIRENPERTEFIGINVKLFQLIAFMISGFFAAIAGALFGIFNHSIFPDFIFWPQSAEVLIMSLLGGIYNFFGPVVGAAVLLYLRMQVTSFTQYWPLILGTILALLLFFFPGGIVGFLKSRQVFTRKNKCS